MVTTATYEQATGLFSIFDCVDDGGVERCLYECVGYAGRGDWKNRPEGECRRGEGPLPRGVYRVGVRQDHPRLGPGCFPLFPFAINRMCGRSGFWVHGDSRRNPGNASHGCIILNRAERDAIEHYAVRTIEVVPGRKAKDLK